MLSSAKHRLDELSSRQQVLSDELNPTRESKFLEFYVRMIPRMLNAERCSVFIHDVVNGKIWLKAGTALQERGIEVSVKNSIVGEVISSGKPVITSDLQSRDGTHKSIDTTTGFITREIICVPIRSADGSTITGAIQVLNKKGGGRFTEEDQSFLEEVGEHFQAIVESIYVGQEAIGMTRDAVTTAGRAVLLGGIAVFASFLVITVLGVYGGLQPWFVDKPPATWQPYTPPGGDGRAPSPGR
ncbi:MAG: GAF domain-containing protein [Betaproteobacteria bacterium]|nr:GAF domain-containing protein [Betaproteobacteria bacterium]